MKSKGHQQLPHSVIHNFCVFFQKFLYQAHASIPFSNVNRILYSVVQQLVFVVLAVFCSSLLNSMLRLSLLKQKTYSVFHRLQGPGQAHVFTVADGTALLLSIVTENRLKAGGACLSDDLKPHKGLETLNAESGSLGPRPSPDTLLLGGFEQFSLYHKTPGWHQRTLNTSHMPVSLKI